MLARQSAMQWERTRAPLSALTWASLSARKLAMQWSEMQYTAMLVSRKLGRSNIEWAALRDSYIVLLGYGGEIC